MKAKILIFFLVIPGIIYSCSDSKIVTIEGYLEGYDGKSEVYYILSPINDLSFEPDTIHPDSSGYFTITCSIDSISFLVVYHQQNDVRYSSKLYLQPGKSYSFISEGFTV